ncbi:MAG TPA: SusD/RagB family nutrient-binding outer membrane lipoprotein [Puia sp.]|jgi:hypothetical protein|nr:SusD/RagB family nutrient-binding outer membrane lipoprotein [Puia sp.]
MFKRIKSYLYLSILVLLIGAVGCKKNTFNINDVNPNVPSNVSPKFILSGALVNTASYVRGGNSDYIELYMGYWAVSGDYIPVTQTLTYATTTDYYSGNWDNGFLILKNFRQMEVLAASDPNATNYLAIAKIMEAFVWQRLVDQYNDIPYTNALNGGTVNFPVYDKAADVYTSLIHQLDTAITIINNALPTAELPGKYDVMFGNLTPPNNPLGLDEMTLWAQFANTLKLKIALNLTKSSANSSLITTALQGLTPSSFLQAGYDAAINPLYSNNSENQQSPFYNDMGFSTSGAVQNNESYYRACDYIVNFMYNTKDSMRLYQLFAANAQNPSVVLGRPFGSNVSVNQDNQHISAMGPGLLQQPNSSAVILPAAENFYMQAEAALDGYLAGTPGALYQTGMEESFRLLQVSGGAAAADAFIAGSADPRVNFGSSNNQLQTIILQEWVAVSGFDPLASWNNWRRLGIPTDLPVSQFSGNVATHVPYRLLYPTSEHSYNSSNLAGEGDINNLSSKIFWMP